MTEKKSYDVVNVKQFHPNHAFDVRFERQRLKPFATAKLKLSRQEALWLLCEHVHDIVEVEGIMAMGQYGSDYHRTIMYANERIKALVESDLVDRKEVKDAYDQVLRACGGPFKNERPCDCERCRQSEPPPTLEVPKDPNAFVEADIPF